MAEIFHVDYLDIQVRIHCTHGHLVPLQMVTSFQLWAVSFRCRNFNTCQLRWRIWSFNEIRHSKFDIRISNVELYMQLEIRHSKLCANCRVFNTRHFLCSHVKTLYPPYGVNERVALDVSKLPWITIELDKQFATYAPSIIIYIWSLGVSPRFHSFNLGAIKQNFTFRGGLDIHARSTLGKIWHSGVD